MSPTRTITVPGYKRPDVFRGFLEHLTANDLAGWRIHIQLEPTDMVDQYKAVAAQYLSGHDYEITVNPKRLGLRANTFALMEKVFTAGSELNIYLEEDVFIASDVTRLAAWYHEHYRPEWFCLSLLSGGCGGYGYQSFGEYADILFPSKSFNSWGFVVRREEWQRHFRKVWMAEDRTICGQNGKVAGGWDWTVYHYLLAAEGLYALQSAAARATHADTQDGEHGRPACFELTFSGLTLTPGIADPASYRVLTLAALPHPLRQYALLWDQFNMALRAMSMKERQNLRLGRWTKILGLALVLASAALFWFLTRAVPQMPAVDYAGLGLADVFILAGLAWWFHKSGKIKWIASV